MKLYEVPLNSVVRDTLTGAMYKVLGTNGTSYMDAMDEYGMFFRPHVMTEVEVVSTDGWVNLTTEDIKEVAKVGGWDDSWQSIQFARAVIQRFKEKN